MDDSLALVPYIDFANHSCDGQSYIDYDASQQVRPLTENNTTSAKLET